MYYCGNEILNTSLLTCFNLLSILRTPLFRLDSKVCLRTLCISSGNADVDTVVASTLKVLDAANARLDLPVYRGCAHPLVEPPHFCPEIHGVDSLGDLEPPLPTPPHRKVAPGHAVTAMLAALRSSADASVTLICLAPLTNLACALRTDAKVMAAKVGIIRSICFDNCDISMHDEIYHSNKLNFRALLLFTK